MPLESSYKHSINGEHPEVPTWVNREAYGVRSCGFGSVSIFGTTAVVKREVFFERWTNYTIHVQKFSSFDGCERTL